ncbi:MAG: glutamate--tRNA ligase [Peptococcaceae bacterium]|nr:glutamate--tRNA ligase [Peptococcaceae bacterium]
MSDDFALAEFLFPEDGPEADYESLYPRRAVSEGVMVTRFAPSPTGFLHIGGVYTALINERFAHQSGGRVLLRIEDTDRKREIEKGAEMILEALSQFRVFFDEGVTAEAGEGGGETGVYGPYRQSLRGRVYRDHVKALIRRGKAYPSFATTGELEELRRRQEALGADPGYYGEWALDRDLTFEEIRAKAAAGAPYVVRLRSPGSPGERVGYQDLIKGPLEMQANVQDVVILKTDGLPTYHFAHVVDDHWMGVTHVLRADEWLASAPVHLQLFEAMGWAPPQYGHIAPVLKAEGSSRRKLSKRKDPEAAASYYAELGFPEEAVREYLMMLMNSNYEEWRMERPDAPLEEFPVSFDRMSAGGALLDMNKLADVSKNFIAGLSKEDLYRRIYDWARRYRPDFADILDSDPGYGAEVFHIEREAASPRKDIAKWADGPEVFGYFFDSVFEGAAEARGPLYPEGMKDEDVRAILRAYADVADVADDKNAWMEKIRVLCDGLGYARDKKTYKKAPEAYKGQIGDVTMVIRVALAGRRTSPDLYEMMRVMGRERVAARLGA